MKYSLNWLQSQIEQNIPVEYFFFWGHTQKKENIINKSCFSQWYSAFFTVEGKTFATAEHWMMAKKLNYLMTMKQWKKYWQWKSRQ